ncbi:MAG: DUF2157 domain-containing protein [Desulfobacteraceae bacterium]|nr:DUF2157 domain-containing protein [Desulfobacteraceae bacterium]
MGLIRLLKNDLAREIRDWTAEDLISKNQAISICARYGIDFNNQDQKSRGYMILVSLGYLFLGLALITLMGANWESIPRGLRMGGLIVLTLGTNGLGLIKIHQGRFRAGIGFFFLGSLFYGASIMLIAQIYHIGEHFPDGILWWALGVLPIALVLKSLLLMILACTLGLIWFFVESSLGYFPLAFLVFLLGMAWHLYRNHPSRILFLGLVFCTGLFLEYALSWYLGGFGQFMFEVENFWVAGGWFILCHGFARWLVLRTETDLVDYGTLLGLWSLRFFILTLFIFSFEESWKELITAQWHAPGLTILVAGWLCLLSMWLSHRADKTFLIPSLISLCFMSCLAGVIWSDNKNLGLYFQILDNLVLVISGVWLIIQGIKHSISHYFFLGVITILLTGLIRYIDLVGNYTGAAALFSGFAVILLATARFWKSRLGPGGKK